ncbi:unnamed protein product, partial [Iphiclides podalirius]
MSDPPRGDGAEGRPLDRRASEGGVRGLWWRRRRWRGARREFQSRAGGARGGRRPLPGGASAAQAVPFTSGSAFALARGERRLPLRLSPSPPAAPAPAAAAAPAPAPAAPPAPFFHPPPAQRTPPVCGSVAVVAVVAVAVATVAGYLCAGAGAASRRRPWQRGPPPTTPILQHTRAL